MKLVSILVLFFCIACDLKTPTDNNLLDLKTAVNFFDISKVATTVLRFPSNENITSNSGWTITDDVFEISLSTQIEGTDSLMYITNISYDIFMETDRAFSLIGVDSLIQNIDLELVNTNPHYDYTDRIEFVISQLQYKTTEDDEYQNVVNLDSLRLINLEMKFRYFFRIASGLNYQFGVIPGPSFYLNTATYRIRLKLLGFYL